MSTSRLTIATCQFAVSADVRGNGQAMRAQIAEAAGGGADIVHFGECALSGYCRANFPTWDGYDWDLLREETVAVLAAFRSHHIWGVFGSSHRLTGDNLPHNSVYVVTPEGVIADRYDKRRCSMGDLECYMPGDHPVVFAVNGVRCGIVICLEERFPDLWQAYADIGVDCIFHSTSCSPKATEDTIFSMIGPVLAQANAQQYQVFVSVAGWSPPFQEFPSLWVKRSGKIGGLCQRHASGMTINAIPDDPEEDRFYAMVRQFRADARRGAIYAGRISPDPRSSDRTGL